MKHIYAFETEDDFNRLKPSIEKFINQFNTYQQLLTQKFQLIDPPKAVVWTTGELTTQIFSNNPITAYTNKNNIYISADINYWKDLFLKQLVRNSIPSVETFYKNLSNNQIFTIIAHELTHH